jgi:hypothetical protein
MEGVRDGGIVMNMEVVRYVEMDDVSSRSYELT